MVGSGAGRRWRDLEGFDARRLGRLARGARIGRGLTLRDVADGLGLRTVSAVFHLEVGRRQRLPGPARLEALARIIGLQQRDLLMAAGYDPGRSGDWKDRRKAAARR